jgi:hypothetical protein
MFGVKSPQINTDGYSERLEKKLTVNRYSAVTPEVTTKDRFTTLENLKFNENGSVQNYSEVELAETLTGILNFDLKGTAVESFKKNHIAMSNIAYLASEYQDPSIKSLASSILNQIIANDKKDYLVFGANDKKNLINFQALVSASPDNDLDSYQKVAKFLSEMSKHGTEETLCEKLEDFLGKLKNGCAGEEGFILAQKFQQGEIAKELSMFLGKPAHVLDSLMSPEKIHGAEASLGLIPDQNEREALARELSRVAKTIFLEECPASLGFDWKMRAAELIEVSVDPVEKDKARQGFIKLFHDKFEHGLKIGFQVEDLSSLQTKLSSAFKNGDGFLIISKNSVEAQGFLEVLDPPEKASLLAQASRHSGGDFQINVDQNLLSRIESKLKEKKQEYLNSHDDVVKNLAILNQVSFTLSSPFTGEKNGDSGFGAIFTRSLFEKSLGEKDNGFIQYLSLDALDSDKTTGGILSLVHERATAKAGDTQLSQGTLAAERQVNFLTANFTDRSKMNLFGIDQVQITEWFNALLLTDTLKDYQILGFSVNAAEKLNLAQNENDKLSKMIQEQANLILSQGLSISHHDPNFYSKIQVLATQKDNGFRENDLSEVMVSLREAARHNPEVRGDLMTLSNLLKDKIVNRREMQLSFLEMINDEKSYQRDNGSTSPLSRLGNRLIQNMNQSAIASHVNAMQGFLQKLENTNDLEPFIQERKNNLMALKSAFKTISENDSSADNNIGYDKQFSLLREHVSQEYLKKLDVLQISLATSDKETFSAHIDSMQKIIPDEEIRLGGGVRSAQTNRTFRDTMLYYLSEKFAVFLEIGLKMLSGSDVYNQQGGRLLNGTT